MSNNPLLRNSIDSSVVTNLMAMGFSKDQVEIALRRASNDPNMAVEYLSQGPLVDDASFDLMANAPPEQSVRAPTVFQPHTGGHEGTDHFVEGITQGSISEMVDARKMGFTHQQAEDALKNTNGDVNEALTLLLSR